MSHEPGPEVNIDAKALKAPELRYSFDTKDFHKKGLEAREALILFARALKSYLISTQHIANNTSDSALIPAAVAWLIEHCEGGEGHFIVQANIAPEAFAATSPPVPLSEPALKSERAPEGPILTNIPEPGNR